MLMINNLSLTNFRSFRGKHDWALPTKGGLYFLTGENTLNPKLDRNDCGKSTLIDAIRWCLYGATSRGLKAGDIISWGLKTAEVSVTLTVGETTATITRSQSPNNLTLNGKVVAQDEVTKFLRIGPEAFGYSVILPQFGDSFFDLKPAEKLALFSEIMELDGWLEKSQEAADSTAKLAADIDNLESKIHRAEDKYEGISLDIVNLVERQKTYEKERKAEIRRYQDTARQIRSAIRDNDAEIKTLKKRRSSIGKTLRSIQVTSEAKEIIFKEIEGSYWKLKDAKTRLESDRDHLNHELREIGSITGICPTCRQTVDTTHLKKTKSTYLEKLEKVEAKLASDKKLLQQADKELSAAEDELKHLQASLINLNKEDIGIEHDLRRLIAANEDLQDQADLQDAQRRLEKPNPYEEMLKLKEQALEEVSAYLSDLNQDLEVARENHAATSYWVMGFKQIRLTIVEETLRALEVEVNSALSSLGMTDWRIEFDVERENKSGGVTKGFIVLVYSPEHKAPVRYESLGGGVLKLISLAGTLGLSNLIMQRAGLTSKVEFFDEPSTHVSPGPILAIAETLHSRAVTQDKVIFLIDHNTIDFGDFEGVITVVKTKQGSTIHESLDRTQ